MTFHFIFIEKNWPLKFARNLESRLTRSLTLSLLRTTPTAPGRHNVICGSGTMQASVRRSADRRRPPWGLVAKKSRAAQSNWPTRARGQILSLVVCKRQAGRIFGEKVVGSGPVRSYIHASVRHLATVADPWITLCRPDTDSAEHGGSAARTGWVTGS